jgi:hypothetical protein
LPSGFNAVRNDFYHNDPTFPAPPADFSDPVINIGPDADSYRDPADGIIKDASEEGVRTEQINREVKGENQLQVFNELGVFSADIGGDFADFPRLVDPLDKSEDLAQRVHQPGAVARTILDLRYTTPLEATNAVGFFPTLGEFALEDPQIVNPGSPENSTVLQRMLTLGTFRMPALATSRVDREGAEVVQQWIQSLGGPTAVTELDVVLTSPFSLEQNFPNPFNPQTQIVYQLAKQGQIVLRVYNLLGETVATLVNEYQSAGRHTVLWNGRDSAGKAAAAGVYFYKLDARGREACRSRGLGGSGAAWVLAVN